MLLRHGQTAWNAELRGQGQTDIELDETGHGQAATVAPHIAALRPVALWTSDLARATGTAAYVATACGLEARPDPRLREFDLGRRTGMTMPEYAAAYPEEYADFRAGRIDVAPGGETSEVVTKRMLAALHDMLDSLAPGECAVAVGHGGALKTAVLAMLNWPAEAWTSMHGLENCGWAELDDSGHDGELRLLAWNRAAPATPETPDFTSSSAVG